MSTYTCTRTIFTPYAEREARVTQMMQLIEAYFVEIEAGVVSGETTLQEYITQEMKCDGEALIKLCLHEELDMANEDTTITEMTAGEMEALCSEQRRRTCCNQFGWLCSWQRNFLVWKFYHSKSQ